MILALLALFTAASEPPRTVNGAVIGTAEQFQRDGPLAICLESTRIDLDKGHRSYLDYLGIHAGSVRIVTAQGEIKISEGDIWAILKGMKRLYDTANGFIDRIGRGRRTRYLIYAPSEYSEKLVPRVWVEGSGIRGTKADRRILDRVTVSKKPPEKCDQRFDYGWDMLLGNE